MPAVCLPDQPSFSQLRNQAKDLRRAVLAGSPQALAEVAERFPDAVPDSFPLHTAQLVVARRYGFPSWSRLKRHMAVIERYSRFPDRMQDDGGGLADSFLRLASVYYTDDEPERWAQARRLLAADHNDIAVVAWTFDRHLDAVARGTVALGDPCPHPAGKAARTDGSRCSTSLTPGRIPRSASMPS